MPAPTIEERIRYGTATLEELSQLGAERVAEIKSDPDNAHYRGSTHVALKAADAGDRKILRLIASTYDKDHYGDRVSVKGKDGGKGWQLEDYNRQGGVYLWCHNMGSVKAPIGQALRTWTGKVGKAAAGLKAAGLDENKQALMQDVEFLSADDGPGDEFKFGETIYLLMSGEGTRSGKGMMGSSVGFLPVKTHRPKDQAEREKLDIGEWGVEFHEQKLLENSATPTPANPFASVIGAKNFKSIEATVLDEIKYMEEAGLHDPTLLKMFRERAILGPKDAEDKLAARLSSRVFMSLDGEADGGAKTSSDYPECRFDVETMTADAVEKAIERAALHTDPDGGMVVPKSILQDILDGKPLPAPAKQECSKCHEKNAVWHELHADTGMDEWVVRCPDCGSDVPADDHKAAAEGTETTGGHEAPTDDIETLEKGISVEAGSTGALVNLDAGALEVLTKAYQSADFAMEALSAILDAVENKNTDPDFQSSFGINDVSEEIRERLDNIERAIQSLSESGAKTTARTDHEAKEIDLEGLAISIAREAVKSLK